MNVPARCTPAFTPVQVPLRRTSYLCRHVKPSSFRLHANFRVFANRETGYEAAMALLWLLVLLLIIFAIIGGVAISNWLFVILIIALILLLVGYL